MEQISSFNLFRIPHIDDGSINNITLISVIDASGSMSHVWPKLAESYNRFASDFAPNVFTFTFDTSFQYIKNGKLSFDINKHGGGGTNITAPFEEVNRILSGKIQTQTAIILFISDGDDNNYGKSLNSRLNQIKTTFKCFKQLGFILKFYCLGIGVEFPTFIAMRLRDIYD